MELQGKSVVITGASRGIGRSLAVALAEKGCHLLLTALEEDELTCISEHLNSALGFSAAFMPADLTKDCERRCFVDWVGSRQPPFDILINNAGAGYFSPFASSDTDDLERTLLLNIRVPTLLIRELLPLLRGRPEAKIVNISSAVSRLPYPGLAVYGAAKGFLSSLSESLACELSATGVSVLCFHPGFTDTSFMATAGMDMSRVPKFLISRPETVAARIVKAIEKNATWAYADLGTRLGGLLAGLLPRRVRYRVFRNLFWRFPDED